MAQTIDEIMKVGPGPFEARPTYSATGDCVEYFFEDADHYADRVDCWLTVYKAFSDKRLVGFQFKNVAALLSKFKALGLDCRVSGSNWAIRLDLMIAFVPYVEKSAATDKSYLDVVSRAVNTEKAFDLVPCGDES